MNMDRMQDPEQELPILYAPDGFPRCPECGVLVFPPDGWKGSWWGECASNHRHHYAWLPSVKPTAPKVRASRACMPGSRSDHISALSIGQSIWIETTPETHQRDLTLWNMSPKERRPLAIMDFELELQSYTAIPSKKFGGRPAYLICITRIK